MGSIDKKLKAYVRYDGSGRVVAGSLILRKKKPKVGKWVEIPAYECCTAATGSFFFMLNPGPTGDDACAETIAFQYYTATSNIGIGTILYSDSGLTTPAGDYWYASASTGLAYQVTGGAGVITAQQSCGV